MTKNNCLRAFLRTLHDNRLLTLSSSPFFHALDAEVKTPDENPSIGILLCKSKSKMTVEYALKDATRPIGIASYTVLKKLPKELKDQLPSAEQIAMLLGDIE